MKYNSTDCSLIRESVIEVYKPFFVYDRSTMLVKVYPTSASLQTFNSTCVNPLTDELIICDTSEQLMDIFLDLGFINIPQVPWEYNRNIRIFLSDTDMLNLISAVPEITTYIATLKSFTVSINSGRWIYLEELYPEHDVILRSYNIENNPNYPSYKYETRL